MTIRAPTSTKNLIRSLQGRVPRTVETYQTLLPVSYVANTSNAKIKLYQVNYVVKGGRLYEPGEVAPGHATVVSRFLRTGYLWDTVRVMGGAYGGFSRFSPSSGLFSCLSYRDPNLGKTLENYDGCSGEL